ncbi:MAG: hypothetical protein LBC60_08545 [Spirochaetaceae bacterium]|jgi:hypothetical protein|nr:hypothetical protein [Spirochaetaceae bacterium]
MIFGKPGVMSTLLYCFIGLAVPAPVFAYTVSFVVIETGPVQDGVVRDSANLWENGLMDVFFNAGHIVSNAHTLRVTREILKDFPDEVQGDIDEARQGGVDFFVMALLDYPEADKVPGTAVKPRQILLRVFSVNPYQKVYEQKYSGPVRDELTQVKSAARSILPHLRDR